jgi:hypothetical protein
MFSLYLFGGAVELLVGEAHFLAIYFGAVMGGSLLSLYIHRHHEYRAYGASGGVCGVIFAYILLFPGANILVFPLPIGIPAWLYAIGYLAGSFYGMRTGIGNVGHDAHLGGAIIGLLIAAGLHPSSVRSNLTMFLIVLVVAVLLLIYLWVNPLYLAPSSPFARAARPAGLRPTPRQIQEPDSTIDDILEKVSKRGIHSLTKEEQALLAEASERARRRARTKKPESGLVI